jgi:hypothetical protein
VPAGANASLARGVVLETSGGLGVVRYPESGVDSDASLLDFALSPIFAISQLLDSADIATRRADPSHWRFLRFEKDYRPGLTNFGASSLWAVVTDSACNEEILVAANQRPPLLMSIAEELGVATAAEIAAVDGSLAKTDDQLRDIYDRLRRQTRITRRDNERADKDAEQINCVANWVETTGMDPDLAATLCKNTGGFGLLTKRNLILAALGVVGIALLPTAIKLTKRTFKALAD